VDFFCAGWLLACVILFAELDAELGDHHDNPENRRTHGISIYLSLVEQAGTARHFFFICVMGSIFAVTLRSSSVVHSLSLIAVLASVEAVVHGMGGMKFGRSRHRAPDSHAVVPLAVVPLTVVPLTLTWEEFSARHGCFLESEPSIQQSLKPYNNCGALINSSSIQREVNRSKHFVGVSVRDQKATAFGPHARQWAARIGHILADLNVLAEQVQLPNVQFITWLHDGACFSSRECKPIFAQEKNRACDGGIFSPPRSASGFVARSPGGARGGQLHSGEGNMRVAWMDNAVPFRAKKDRAFFRGSTTGGVYTKATWKTMPRSRVVQVPPRKPCTLHPNPRARKA